MTSILVAELNRRVFDSVDSAAQTLKARGGPETRCGLCESFDVADLGRALQRLGPPGIVLLVQPPGQSDLIASAVEVLRGSLGPTVGVAVAPDPGTVEVDGVGWIPSYSGVDQILWGLMGANAIVARPELSSPSVFRRLVEDVPRLDGFTLVLGKEPVEALDRLHNEVSDVLQCQDNPRLSWRTACALAQAAPLPPGVNDRIKIARHLCGSVPWFGHHIDDARKAVGNLAAAWGYTLTPIDEIAAVALRRGYPRQLPNPADAVERLSDPTLNLDVSGRRKFSGGGIECDEMPLRLQ